MADERRLYQIVEGPPVVLPNEGQLVGAHQRIRYARQTTLFDDPGVHDMAEFFVVRRHRRRGVGEAAARALFDRFPGRWEVRQTRTNQAATRFWVAVIDRYTRGDFTRLDWDDPRWRGPVQRFEARPP